MNLVSISRCCVVASLGLLLSCHSAGPTKGSEFFSRSEALEALDLVAKQLNVPIQDSTENLLLTSLMEQHDRLIITPPSRGIDLARVLPGTLASDEDRRLLHAVNIALVDDRVMSDLKRISLSQHLDLMPPIVQGLTEVLRQHIFDLASDGQPVDRIYRSSSWLLLKLVDQSSTFKSKNDVLKAASHIFADRIVFVAVHSDPSEAVVVMNRTNWGRTPTERRGLPAGRRYIFVITKDGYEPEHFHLHLPGDSDEQDVEVKLRPMAKSSKPTVTAKEVIPPLE